MRPFAKLLPTRVIIIIIIIIKGIYIAQVRKGHKCAMSAEMAEWLRNCLCLLLSKPKKCNRSIPNCCEPVN